MDDNTITNKDVVALLSQSFFMVNKQLLLNLGLETALWISDLTSKLKYFEKTGNLDARGFFYNTQGDIEKSTGLSKFQQINIVKQLKELDIIEVEKRGLPPKNYYRFNYKILIKYLSDSQAPMTEKVDHNGLKSRPIPSEKLDQYYNKNKDNKNKVQNCLSSINSSNGNCPVATDDIPLKSSDIKHTTEIKKVMAYWSSSGLKVPGVKTKAYKLGIEYTRGLLDGSKFGIVYTVDQIIMAIDNFKRALLPEYAPSDKTYLKSLTLYTFIYSPYNVKTDKPSMFQYYLDNVPALYQAPKVVVVPDPDPSITNYLKNFYKKEILGSMETSLSAADETYFRQATAMLIDFYNRYKDRYITPWWGVGDLAHVFTKVIMSYIEDRFNADTSKVEPWWFKRADFFNKRLPAYMHAQALIKEIPDISPLRM